MAWSCTVLNWGIWAYPDAYKASGEMDNALNGVKWALDLFVKANPNPDTYYCQVGLDDSIILATQEGMMMMMMIIMMVASEGVKV